MRLGQAIAPLVSASTFRRGVHLLLGGVILIPYLLLAVGFGQMLAEPDVPLVPVFVLMALAAVIATLPPFLPVMRALEIAAARNLLDVPLPDPERNPPWEARWRAATWYVLHLVAGGCAMFALLFAAPMVVTLVGRGAGMDEGWLAEVNLTPFDQLDGVPAIITGVAFVPATGYLVAAVGRGLGAVAPVLLGPSAAERISRLEAEARRLSERNRLARELHDSLGHALTVTTLQAAAARQAIDSDPDFARRAMAAVEDAGRAAMDDLDHVLGLLRDGRPQERDTESRAPQRDLRDLDRLITESRGAGLAIDAVVDLGLDGVPAAVSREAYRVVQEALTNALRHAGAARVTLRVAGGRDGVTIAMDNPIDSDSAGTRARAGEARGLAGMRERINALGGAMSAGPVGDTWRVTAHLPAGRLNGRET